MDKRLLDLKIRWSNHIPWGKVYGRLSLNRKVLQLAWKDSQLVLFMTTVSNGRKKRFRTRRRPKTKDKWLREVFGQQPFKKLGIPDFIDMYNHLMNGVDRADQIRSYYRTKRRQYRTWRPLWNFLLQTTVCNSALIWIDQGHGEKKKSGHLKFRTILAQQLMSYSSSSKHTLPVDGQGVRTNLNKAVQPSSSSQCGSHIVLSKDTKACKACMAVGRVVQGVKRKALEELSINSIRTNQNGQKRRRSHVPRSRYGCSVCQIHLCREGDCWFEHLKAKETA